MNLHKVFFISAFILPEEKKSVQVLWCSDLMKWKVLHLIRNLSVFHADLGTLQTFRAFLHIFHAPCRRDQIHYSKLSGLHICSDSLLAISSTCSCKAEGHPCLTGVCSEPKWLFLKAVLLCMCDNVERKVCAIQPFLLAEHYAVKKALVRKLHQFLHTSFCFRVSAV